MADKSYQQIQMEAAGMAAQLQASGLRQSSADLSKTRRGLRSLEITAEDLLESVGETATDLAQQTYYQPDAAVTRMIEGKSHHGHKPVVFGDWQPTMVIKESASGKQSTVWKLRHQRSGQLVEESFRHEIVARTAAAILNETNNQNDPRLSRILELCAKERSVMLEMRQSKRLMETADRQKAAILKNKIEEQKYILAGVRAKLGVK